MERHRETDLHVINQVCEVVQGTSRCHYPIYAFPKNERSRKNSKQGLEKPFGTRAWSLKHAPLALWISGDDIEIPA